MNHKELGARWFNSVTSNNLAGEALSDARASVTQEQALFFNNKPEANTIEEVALGYLQASELASKKSGKVGASQIRLLGANQSQITFKSNDDGDIIGFGHGSISKEYNAILLLLKSPVERYVKTLQAIDALKAEFATALMKLEAESADWKAKSAATFITA